MLLLRRIEARLADVTALTLAALTALMPTLEARLADVCTPELTAFTAFTLKFAPATIPLTPALTAVVLNQAGRGKSDDEVGRDCSFTSC